MIIRSIDANGDWNFGKGLSDYNTGELAVEESIKTRLLSWAGDCFFALQDFIDWKGLLDVGQQFNLLSALRTTILQSFGVVGITSLDANFDGRTRNFTVKFNIQTIYSQSFQSFISLPVGALGGS